MPVRRVLLSGWLTLLAGVLVMYCLLTSSILAARAAGLISLVGGHFLLWLASRKRTRASAWTDRAGWVTLAAGVAGQYRYFVDGYIEAPGLLWLICSWGVSLTLFAWGLGASGAAERRP